jgi:hypothetical protein
MPSSSASPIGTESLSSLVFVVGVGLIGAGVGYGALLAIAEDIAVDVCGRSVPLRRDAFSLRVR